MSRPLLVTDCDEVLLHMVAHFGRWLDEAHDIDFTPEGGSFADALRHRGEDRVLGAREAWEKLDGFFATEMHRQTLVPGAAEALRQVGEVADILVLTNLGDHCHAGRVAQLAALGVHHEVICNQGGKGVPMARVLAERQPGTIVFVDDLAVHHASVAEHAPQVWRLHMVAEPSIAGGVPRAPDAHARIDDWADALPWVLAKLAGPPAA